MSTFGWSYPPGAANDPNAPYNQDFDDEHCVYCGADLDNIYPTETPEDEEALDEGFCNVEHQKAWESNGYSPSDKYGMPDPSKDQLDKIESLRNEVYEWNKNHTIEHLTLEEITKSFPEEDFEWDNDDPGDPHVYCCGEKDCPVQWHLAYYNSTIKRVDGKLSIDIHSGDSDGNWDIDTCWEEGDDISELSYHFGQENLNQYFMGWVEYWLDAACTGNDPCDHHIIVIPNNGWVDACINHAEDSLKYLKMSSTTSNA